METDIRAFGGRVQAYVVHRGPLCRLEIKVLLSEKQDASYLVVSKDPEDTQRFLRLCQSDPLKYRQTVVAAATRMLTFFCNETLLSLQEVLPDAYVREERRYWFDTLKDGLARLLHDTQRKVRIGDDVLRSVHESLFHQESAAI